MSGNKTRKFRYNTTGRWFKGNTHLHTTFSDGGLTDSEAAGLYAEAGYHFLFRTDHWAPSAYGKAGRKNGILWLDGVELDGRDRRGGEYHVVCLGRVRGLEREMGFERALKAARAQGALLVLAHPLWCGNSTDEALRWRFDGVEIYNHVCRWLNGKGGGEAHLHAMLEKAPATLVFAADDSHLKSEHPGWNGGWIMVNAAECSARAIMAAIRAGNFYASCGPEFKSIRFCGGRVEAETSPVCFARLVGPRSAGFRTGSFKGKVMRRVEFDIPADWRYAMLEIEDSRGRRAWTNTLFGA